jgi:hypothetical protein
MQDYRNVRNLISRALVPPLPQPTRNICCIFLGLSYFIFYAAFPIDYPLIDTDSSGYIHMNSQRSTGYPLFLWAWRALGLSLEQIV